MAHAVILAGLGYGDEGKGSVTDFVVRATGSSLVVRYNGGAQAAHNVVTDDDRHHTFAQFGSGTFAGAETLLSRFMLVNPISLMHEGSEGLKRKGISDPFKLMHVERDALVTTPFHVSANRIREMLRTGRHGSCGMGIGETMQDFVEGKDSIFVRDLQDQKTLYRKLQLLQYRKRNEIAKLFSSMGQPRVDSPANREYTFVLDPQNNDILSRAMEFYAAFADGVNIVGPEFLEGRLKQPDTIVFEGAQGVLLDQDFGFQPHTTWTDITFKNADQLIGPDTPTIKIGVLRAYMTRHGAGPFVTEDKRFDAYSAKDHNRQGDWQGVFRSGAFDLVATRYALDVLGEIDGLAINHVDCAETMGLRLPICYGYEIDDSIHVERMLVRRPFDLAFQERMTKKLFTAKPLYREGPRGPVAEELADELGVPLAIVGDGPKASDKLILGRVLR